MAKQNKIYFSHDAGARRDPKMLKLRSEYGAEGVGIWWMLIETLRESDDYSISLASASDLKALAFDFGVEQSTLEMLIDSCIEWQLLTKQGVKVYSDSLNKRMELKDEISKKRTNAVQMRYKCNTNVEQDDYNSSTNVRQSIKYKDKVIDNDNSYRHYHHPLPPAGAEEMMMMGDDSEPILSDGQDIPIDYQVLDNKFCRSTYLKLFNRMPTGLEVNWWERLRREEFTNEQIAEGLKLSSDSIGDKVKFAYLKKVVTTRRDMQISHTDGSGTTNGGEGYDYIDPNGNFSRTVIL